MTTHASAGALRRRVEELDRKPTWVAGFEADPRLVRFVSVLGSCTNTSLPGGAESPVPIAAAEADEIVGDCLLLEGLARDEPTLVRGPLDRDRQQWIATGRHRSAPERSAFTDTPPAALSTKPFELGLFTSTATTRQRRSCWRTLIDRGSSLYPPPWHVWDIEVSAGASVLEISSAREWAEFVEAYAIAKADLIYPDWPKVASDHDGVHLTLSAIAAIQGFNLETGHGLTAAAFWDVESTLWLRWVFGATRLSQVVS